jgi:hypothetical protein
MLLHLLTAGFGTSGTSRRDPAKPLSGIKAVVQQTLLE